MYQCVRAVQRLSKKGVVHLDIKPDNILIGLDSFVRICDMGGAWYLNSENKSVICTSGYAAPELEKVRKAPQDRKPREQELAAARIARLVSSKCDVFSLGVTFYQFTFWADPWCMKKLYETYQSVAETEEDSLYFR